MSRPPLIGVTACRQQLGKYSSHTAGDKYVEAAAFAGVPVILPALDVPTEPAQLLASLDGLLRRLGGHVVCGLSLIHI